VKDHLKERILRSLETLSDERGYQVLDYVEFLESKYGERASPSGILAQISDKVEDTMRAGKVPLDAISGTVKIFGGATKVMSGLASAAQAVVEETSRSLGGPPKKPGPAEAKTTEAKPPAAAASPAAEAKPAEPKPTERNPA
jgi:hypothetical protein